MIHISNKWSVRLALAAGIVMTLAAGVGSVDPCKPDKSCQQVGYFKLMSALLGSAAIAASLELSHRAEMMDLEEFEWYENQREIQAQENAIAVEKHLTVFEAMAEGQALQNAGLPATIDVSAQPVPQQLPQATAPVVSQQQVAAPIPVPATPQAIAHTVTPTQPMQMQPQAQQPVLPDGATLIEAAAIADINKYPVVMIVAVPGSGKTMTMNWVVAQLPGKKVLCSHKAEAYHRNMFDLVFGYNPQADRSRWIGDNSTLTTPDRDFDFIASQQGGFGTVAQGYWSLFADVSKRQGLGPTRASQLPVYRDFYDETSYAYSTAFQDPLNPEQLKWGQSLVGSTNKLVFFDGRTNGHQVFFAAQSDSVDIIGLKGLSEARDEMWFLYPGRAAIAYAAQKKRTALSNWLQSRLDQGYGVALLVKQDVYWEVINLPKVDEMKAWEASFAATSAPQQPQQQTGATIYDLVDQAKNDDREAA